MKLTVLVYLGLY